MLDLPVNRGDPGRDPEPEQSNLLMPYFGQGSDAEKSACANSGVKTVGNIPVCALDSDAVPAFPGLVGFQALGAIFNLKAWTPCKFLFLFENVIPKIFLHMESFSSQPSFLLPPTISFLLSLEFWLLEREWERKRSIYMYSDFFFFVPCPSTPYLYSSVSKSDRLISKKTRRFPPGLSQTRSSLLLQPGLSTRYRSKWYSTAPPIPFGDNLFFIFSSRATKTNIYM